MDLRMPDLNMILLAGNLTNDPKCSETKTGTPVVNFYMASNKRFKDRNGTIKEDVCFVGVVAWDNLAVSCRDSLHKGSSVLVTGELQSRKLFPEDGTPRNMVEIKAKKIQFLDINRGNVHEGNTVDGLYAHHDHLREDDDLTGRGGNTIR